LIQDYNTRFEKLRPLLFNHGSTKISLGYKIIFHEEPIGLVGGRYIVATRTSREIRATSKAISDERHFEMPDQNTLFIQM